MPAPPLFAYGTLQDADILAAVLGRPVAPDSLVPATAPGHAAVCYPGRVYPALVARPDAHASGRLIAGLAAFDLMVLDAFEGDEYRRAEIRVRAGGRELMAEAYLPAAAIPADAPAWTLSDWTRRHKPAALAGEIGLAADLRRRLSARRRQE